MEYGKGQASLTRCTYCSRLVLCPFLWGLVLWVSPRVGAQVKAGHTMLCVSVGAP